MKFRSLRRLAFIAFGLTAGWWMYGLIESKSLAFDDVAPTTSPVQLDEKTEAMLAAITKAYAQPFDVGGTLKADFDVAGQIDGTEIKFTSTFGGENRIRHQSSQDMLIIVNEKSATVFDEKAKLFSTNELENSQPPTNVLTILELQNPALLVAMKGDARGALFTEGAKFIRSHTEGEFDLIEIDHDGAKVRYQINREGQFTQIDYDFSEFLKKRGVAGIKTAAYQLTYDKLAPAKIADDTFTFTAPAGARDIAKEPRQNMPRSSVQSLQGKSAPPFEGKDLDGNIVGLFGFKDKVVVLDFWATWCGPCRPALNHLKTYEERFGEDVVVIAINSEGQEDLDETAKMVRAYFEKNKFNFRTILDDGTIYQTYNIAALPTRFLIGRDGTIKKVLVGVGRGADQIFDQAVETELNAK